MKEIKVYNSEKVSLGKALLWNTRPLSFGAVTILMGYLSMFCTDILQMPAALVGTLLMASKIFDGVTDLIAGYIVDDTKTKLGKGRPYELCLIGVWVCTFALFASNVEWSMTMKSVWLLIMYTLIWSIFGTMLNAAETPYIIRAFGNAIAVTKASAIGGVFITIGCMVVSVSLPMAIGALGTTVAGWRKIIIMYAIPLLLIGLLRFLLVPESFIPEQDAKEEKVAIKDILTVLKSNRYIWLLAIISMIPQTISGMGATTYYFNVVVGDITKLSAISMLGLVSTLFILFFPAMMKKRTAMDLIGIFSVIGVIGYIMVFFAGSNMVVLIIAFFLSGLAVLPTSYMRAPIIMDVAEYNERHGRPRMEATLSAATNFTIKIGQALGAFLLGIILSMGGYDGALEVQPDSAIMSIRVLCSFMPAVLMLLSFICAVAYRPLDAFLKKEREKNKQ